MAVPVDKHVVGFDIAMHVAHTMNGLDGEHQLGYIELGPLLRYVVVAHQIDQIAAGHVLHDHVEIVKVLEGVVEAHDPLAIGISHYIALFPEECAVLTLDLV